MDENLKNQLEFFVESLDFMSVGERINTFSRAIKILKAIRKGQPIPKEKVPNNLRFLLDIQDIEEIFKTIKRENKRAVNNYNEMLEVFDKYHLKISKEKVARIAYPRGFKVIEIDVGVYNPFDIYGFTCDGMKKWYQENIKKSTKLFSKAWDEGYEELLIKNKVFGFFIVRYEIGYTFIRPLQPVVFYENRWKGMGKKPRISNAHLLMLFGLLKLGLKEFDDEIRIELAFHPSKSAKKQSEEIAKIAPKILGTGNFRIAVFRKD